ncbi:hypothetical protein NMG60_11029716 [Bertholletia excelsa]
MIPGYLQLSTFEIPVVWRRMIHEGVTPDNFTFASALSGLASLSDLTLGVQVHAQLVKSGHGNEMCIGNPLVDMYLKAQNFEDGLKASGEILQEMCGLGLRWLVGVYNAGNQKRRLEL